jgi:hypothetical protein
MQPSDDRRPDILAGLRSKIASTKDDAPPPLELLARLRGDIVSTRVEPPPAEPPEEFYVEDGFEPEREPFEIDDRSTELDPALGPKMRRRAWEEYARDVAGGGADRRPRKKIRLGRAGVRGWLELTLLLGLMIGLNAFVFPNDPGFRRLEFNPFLLPVVLLALRFGTLIGGAAGLVSALWLLVASRHVNLEDGSAVLPGLLVILGVLTGVLAQHQGERLEHVRDYAGRLEERLARARRLLGIRQSVIGELQSRIEEQAVSVESMYRMSRRMSSTEPTDMFQAILQILHADLRVARAAIYRSIDGSFYLAASLDRRLAPAPFPEYLDADRGLPGLARRLNRRISIFDSDAETLPPSERSPVLACGPIREGEHLHALLVVEDLPLLEFTPSALARLDALLGWASEVRTRLARLSEQTEGDYFDRGVGAYRFPYLAETLRREFQRARRHGLPLRVMRVRIQSFSELPESSVAAARECVSRALFAYLREGDTIGADRRPDSFLAVLPMCEAATATALGFRMLRALEKISGLLPIRLSFEFVDPEAAAASSDATPPPLEAVA